MAVREVFKYGMSVFGIDDIVKNKLKSADSDWRDLSEHIIKIVKVTCKMYCRIFEDSIEHTNRKYLCEIVKEHEDSLANIIITTLREGKDFGVSKILPLDKDFPPEERQRLYDMLVTNLKNFSFEYDVRTQLYSMRSESSEMFKMMQALYDKVDYYTRIHDKSPFANKIDSVRKKEKNHKNPFHYLNAQLGFYGRVNETDKLQSFLDSMDRISTLAVTGYSGSGKSKFIYEFTLTAKPKEPDWKFVYLNQLLINDFASNVYGDYQYDCPLCIIVDYAGRYADKIGAFISHVSSVNIERLPPKIRFILIERQGISKQDKDEKIYPDWFQRLLNSSDAEIKLHGDGFLELSELPESALRSLALDFRNEDGLGIMQKYNGDKDRFELEWGRICSIAGRRGTLTSKIRAVRPLIIMFMVDSSIRNLDYYKWDIDIILKAIIERYEKHWEENLCAGNKDLCASVMKLLMYSTACESWSVGERVNGLENESDLLNSLGHEKLSMILPYVNEHDVYDERMLAFEPDLLGEFFVLNMLKNIASVDKRKELINVFWNANAESFAFFLQMCIDDYSYSDYFKGVFENFNELFLSLDNFDSIQNSEDLVAGLLQHITYIGVPERTKQAIESLSKMTRNQNKDESMALRYVSGLFNRIHDSNLDEAHELLNEIRSIADQYYYDDAICSVYCEALHNLVFRECDFIRDTSKVKTSQLARILSLLETFEAYIENKHSKSEGLMVAAMTYYTRSLVQPMTLLEHHCCIKCLQKATEYINDLQPMPAIDEFVSAMINFTARDDVTLKDAMPFYEMLSGWIQNYNDSYNEVYNGHIEILVNFTLKNENTKYWVSKVEELYLSESSDFTARYVAMALCNYIDDLREEVHVDCDAIALIVQKIKQLCMKHEASDAGIWYCVALNKQLYLQNDVSFDSGVKVAIDFSKALRAYVFSADVDDDLISQPIDDFVEIVNAVCHESDINIVTEYASIISELYACLPQYVRLAECKAFIHLCLCNILAETDANKALDSLNEIKQIYSEHTTNEEINECLAEAILTILSILPVDEMEKELLIISEMHSRFPKSALIADYYVESISIYSSYCESDKIEPMFHKAVKVFSRFRKEETILTCCINIVTDYLADTHDYAKSLKMLDALKRLFDIEKITTDECQEAYTELLNALSIASEVNSHD